MTRQPRDDVPKPASTSDTDQIAVQREILAELQAIRREVVALLTEIARPGKTRSKKRD